MADVIYKVFKADTTVDGSGVITATLSTEDEDRDGDVIRASGWVLDHFLKHPVLLSSHDYSSLRSQIGEWKNVRIEDRKLVGEPHYYHGVKDAAGSPLNPEADWAYELAKRGKAAFSVGFAPIDAQERKGHAYAGQEFLKQELLEASQVTIPSNRGALQQLAKGLRPGPVKEIAEEILQEKRPRTAVKWPVDDNGYGMDSQHCLVPGCDDACQLYAPICSEHLKVLMLAPAEPDGGEADEELMKFASLARALPRMVKGGRTLSTSNLKLLHGALDGMHTMHAVGCGDDGCQYHLDEGDAGKGYERRAMSEGDGASGGVTVHEDGSHASFTGSHSHAHPTYSGKGEDGSHAHEHTHDGDASHAPGDGHEHAKTAAALERKWAHVRSERTYARLPESRKLELACDLEALGEPTKGLVQLAAWSAAFINALPDSSFAAIDSGGSKDADGLTTPRSLRHYPHHGKAGGDGSVDEPHLKAALSRIGDPDNTQAGKAHLEAHAKALGIGESDDKSFDLDDDEIMAAVEAALSKAPEA